MNFFLKAKLLIVLIILNQSIKSENITKNLFISAYINGLNLAKGSGSLKITDEHYKISLKARSSGFFG